MTYEMISIIIAVVGVVVGVVNKKTLWGRCVIALSLIIMGMSVAIYSVGTILEGNDKAKETVSPAGIAVGGTSIEETSVPAATDFPTKAVETVSPPPTDPPIKKVNLLGLSSYASNYAHIRENRSDNLDNQYKKVLTGDDGDWIAYWLAGQYSRFKGTFFIQASSKNAKSVYRFEVWGDDQLLFESPDITQGFIPDQFDINVQGVNALKIIFVLKKGSEWSEVIGIGDPTLE